MKHLLVIVMISLPFLLQSQILNPNSSPTIQNPTIQNQGGINQMAISIWKPNANDKAIVGDFNGDGTDDLCVFRPNGGIWYFDYDKDGKYDKKIEGWGKAGDQPVAGNFNAETARDEIAVLRTSNGMWYIDYNLDGRTDERTQSEAKLGDIALAGNFYHYKHESDATSHRDLNDEYGYFRPSTGEWFVFDYDEGRKASYKYGYSGVTPFLYETVKKYYYQEYDGVGNNVTHFKGLNRPSISFWNRNAGVYRIYINPSAEKQGTWKMVDTRNYIAPGDILMSGSTVADKHAILPTDANFNKSSGPKYSFNKNHYLIRYRPSTGSWFIANSHEQMQGKFVTFTGKPD